MAVSSTMPRFFLHALPLTVWLCTLGGLLLSTPSAWAQNQTLDVKDWQQWYADFERNQYVVEFPLTPENADKLKEHLSRYRFQIIYIPAQSLNAANTAQLRVGFFASYSQAREFISATNYLYSNQHIVHIERQEHQAVGQQLGENPSTATDYYVFAVGRNETKTMAGTSQQILERAKQLYIEKSYSQAIAHYAVLATLADSATAAWARELIGLCYEKLGRRSDAMASYRQLLKEFPQANGRSRIEQRLRGLETAALDERSLRQTAATNPSRRNYTRGVIGQYYRTVSRSVNGGDSEKVLSLLSTDWDIRSSMQWNGHDLRARINGFWLKDELDTDQSEVEFKRVFVDYHHQGSGFEAALGRQKNIDSGVYTSFDGLTVSYPLTPDLRVSASVGQPVYFSDIYDELDYFFYSAHLDWEINSHWQLKSYYIEQTVNDVTDREAVGARAVYIGKKITSFLTVDYDTAFSEINNILLNSNYAATENTNVNFTYGSQRSPFLTATNILIGQADLDLDLYLQSKENKDNLLDDALSRTALNEYFTVSVNTRLTDRLRLIADYYDSALSDIPSTELLQGLPITTDSSGEFHSQSLGLQLVFQDFFLQNDSMSVGLRRNDGDSSTTNQIYINERLRLGRRLTINPRFSYADVQFASNADSQQQFRYSIALTYRPWRNVEFNLEAGNESITTQLSDTRYESDYIFAGYRFNF